MEKRCLGSIEELFQKAEAFVRENFSPDLVWSQTVQELKTRPINQQAFMGEYAYVVYCSGYKQKIVEKYWVQLRIAYHDFRPDKIALHENEIRETVMQFIANKKKIDAILSTAKKLDSMDYRKWMEFKNSIKEEDSFAALQELPFIGPITKYHLARNMGFDTIKPDVHLQRIADHFGRSPFEMCKELSKRSEQLTGHHYPMHTVDTILWRASAEGKLKTNRDEHNE